MTERHRRGLLDTCVLIDLPTLPKEKLPVVPSVGTVTLAELGLGLHTAPDMVERSLRTERLQIAEAVFEPLPFTADAARRFAHLAGPAVAAGRSPKPRKLDLMIAAVASLHRLPLHTRNPRDFVGLGSAVAVMSV